MPFVFISHATLADGTFAARLAHDLQAHGVRYWKAPESIDPGERWPDAIERALETCDTMVLVLTPKALASRWVKTETSIAIQREHQGKMSFIPLDVKQCNPPLLVQNYQMISFRSDYQTGLRALLRRLGVSTKKSPAADLPSTYDFSNLFGKNFDATAMQKWTKPAAAKPEKPSEKKPTQPKAPAKNPASIYDVLKQQPGLLGNLPATAEPKKTQKPPPPKGSAANTFTWAGSILSGYAMQGNFAESPLLKMSLDFAAKGDAEMRKLRYKEAIEHYSKAITAYPTWRSMLSKIDFLLGSIYHRRAECWMGIDFNNMMDRYNKFGIGATATFASLGKLPMFGGGGLFDQSEEYKNAQADFKKAKELGYTPPKKGTETK